MTNVELLEYSSSSRYLAERNCAYRERNMLVALLARIALVQGWPVGRKKTNIEGKAVPPRPGMAVSISTCHQDRSAGISMMTMPTYSKPCLSTEVITMVMTPKRNTFV